jgi:glycosyltransferase involved in cell wall biosynthesis
MRILHVTPAFPPSTGYGGGPAVVHQVCKRLAKRGHEVIVYATDANDKHSRLVAGYKIVDDIEVYYFRNISNWLAYQLKLFLSPQMIRAMRQMSAGVDIIHIHDLRTFQSVVTCYFAQKRIPYVLQAHGVVPNKLGWLGKLKGFFDWLFGYKILQDAARLIALNEREADDYVRMGADRDKITIVPNGVDLSQYTALPRRGLFRERYGLGDARIVLFLGRVHESKGLDLLVQAFADLAEQLPDVKLVIAGPDDGYLGFLQNMTNSLNLGSRVIFSGFLSGQEKLAAFVDADVFATPRFTGFPLTFLEVMACGLPIVTTDVGDHIEGIDGRVGYVTRFDRIQYSNSLLNILTDPRLRASLGQGARQSAENYDWDMIVSRMEAIYQKVLG